MRTDLFIVTFKRDLEYTRFCLLSIAKYVRDFYQVVVLVPISDGPAFVNLARECAGPIPIQVQTFNETPDKGMLHHMAMIMAADQWSQADYIVHVDSDCVFYRPTSPADYFVAGKPVMLRELFSRMDGPVLNWQIAVEKALGWKPAHETMRRHPSVHPRWLYPAVRGTIEARHRCDFLTYIMSCENKYPQTFAEFPTLGAWALRYAPWAHYWIEVGQDPIPEPRLRQFWSHGGVDMKWEGGPQTVRQIVEEILA